MSNPNIDPQSDMTADPETNIFKLKKYLTAFLVDILDLEEGVDKRAVINEIKNKKSMSGANAWMLMCSIVIASIGLDMNSPAVIIGGMLISPLMSPILGIGLAVGINDKETLKKSLSHFGMAVLIAIITSTLYFALSPLGDMTQEIQARTGPGPLDIFIAFFGGIAGIVSIARKDLSTTLPGVAIATALMPPLCVVGFGIATMNFAITISSFFLFFLNTVFVSFSTYLVVTLILKFPKKDYIDAKDKRKNTFYIALFLIGIVAISIFPFTKLLDERKNIKRVEEFIANTIGENKKFLDSYILTPQQNPTSLIMKVYGDSISEDKMPQYKEGLKYVGLKDLKLEIISTSEITMNHIKNLDKKINGMEDMTSQLLVVQKQKKASELAISQLQDELKSFLMDSTKFSKISKEIKIFEPGVVKVIYANGQATDFKDWDKRVPVFIVEWSEKTDNQEERETKLTQFLRLDLNNENLKVLHSFQEKDK